MGRFTILKLLYVIAFFEWPKSADVFSYRDCSLRTNRRANGKSKERLSNLDCDKCRAIYHE